MSKEIKLGGIKIGGKNRMVLIAGPCVIENEKMVFELAGEIKKITARLGVPFIFKASYDKANRTSIKSFRGPGLKKGLEILSRVKKKYRVPLLIDVHCTKDVFSVSRVADIIQIPAFLCRQTDLLLAAARTKKVVNIKKGQFLSPYDMKNVVEKVESAGNNNILLTERGTFFGYNNLVVDMRSIIVMKALGYPVVFDATHSVQLPGGLGHQTGGQREFIVPLAKAAIAVGASALFTEVHPEPKKALSDGPNSIKLSKLKNLLYEVLK